MLQQRAQSRISSPAYGKTVTVGENRDAVLALVQLDARQTLEIEDERPVNSHELLRVERGFDLGQRLLLEVLLAGRGVPT